MIGLKFTGGYFQYEMYLCFAIINLEFLPGDIRAAGGKSGRGGGEVSVLSPDGHR